MNYTTNITLETLWILSLSLSILIDCSSYYACSLLKRCKTKLQPLILSDVKRKTLSVKVDSIIIKDVLPIINSIPTNLLLIELPHRWGRNVFVNVAI